MARKANYKFQYKNKTPARKIWADGTEHSEKVLINRRRLDIYEDGLTTAQTKETDIHVRKKRHEQYDVAMDFLQTTKSLNPQRLPANGLVLIVE